MRKLLWALVLMGLLADPVHAALYWADELEQGTTGFTSTSGGANWTGHITFDTSVFHNGAGSARYNFTEQCMTAAACGGTVNRNFTMTNNDLWTRVWIRAGQTYQGNEINYTTKTYGIRPANGLSKIWMIVFSSPSNPLSLTIGFSNENSPTDGHTENFASSGSLVRNQWVCVEAYHRMNTPGIPDGIEQMYINNVRVLNQTNVQYRQSGSTSMWGTIQMYRQTGRGNLWMDQWAVGNTRIGCDTTPPSIPGNFTVQ
jgi:hypothetical protein